jgi:translation elongation factor P/translation initiation factor 5A
MRIIVSYYERDTYVISDEKWYEAMALCDNNEDDAVNFLLDEGETLLYAADISGQCVEVAREV